jgi:hypothetical protein
VTRRGGCGRDVGLFMTNRGGCGRNLGSFAARRPQRVARSEDERNRDLSHVSFFPVSYRSPIYDF